MYNVRLATLASNFYLSVMEYMAHLTKDKKLATIITQPVDPVKLQKNIALRLMAAIMSQQLNTKVALVIYKRFLLVYNGNNPTPAQVLATPPHVLRAVGLSNAKVGYVQNVARFCIKQKITNKNLLKMSNSEIIEQLTAIKGVGRWTVEMLLMFSLGREDVFAVDDLSIQQAIIKLYNLQTLSRKQLQAKILTVSQKWSPYRTYACIHLWRWKDLK